MIVWLRTTGGPNAAAFTVTVVLQVLVLPLPSSTKKLTVLVPTGNSAPGGGACATVTEVLQASPQLTSAARLERVAVPPEPAIKVWAGAQLVMTGGVVSRTMTERVLVEVLPAPSVAT